MGKGGGGGYYDRDDDEPAYTPAPSSGMEEEQPLLSGAGAGDDGPAPRRAPRAAAAGAALLLAAAAATATALSARRAPPRLRGVERGETRDDTACVNQAYKAQAAGKKCQDVKGGDNVGCICSMMADVGPACSAACSDPGTVPQYDFLKTQLCPALQEISQKATVTWRGQSYPCEIRKDHNEVGSPVVVHPPAASSASSPSSTSSGSWWSSSITWIVLTVIAVVGIAVAVWFFVLRPKQVPPAKVPPAYAKRDSGSALGRTGSSGRARSASGRTF